MDKRLDLRVSNDDLLAIDQSAEACGTSRSSFCRRALNLITWLQWSGVNLQSLYCNKHYIVSVCMDFRFKIILDIFNKINSSNIPIEKFAADMPRILEMVKNSC